MRIYSRIYYAYYMRIYRVLRFLYIPRVLFIVCILQIYTRTHTRTRRRARARALCPLRAHILRTYYVRLSRVLHTYITHIMHIMYTAFIAHAYIHHAPRM